MEATALAGAGGFWIAHPLIKAQIRSLSSGTAGFPLFQSDFRSGATVDTLLGYPYFTSEACKAYDTEGDIFFVKPDGYFLAFEAAGIQNDTTIAFAFDQNLQSFRSTLYMGGAPSLSAAVLRADGSSYASNIVTLAGSRS
jgi:HK97 family phage major capsid protein